MFICKKCGLCCINIDKISELSTYDNGDWICIHLTNDNLCDIYNSRPDICNVNAIYIKKYKNYMTREEFDQLNTEGCKYLQKIMQFSSW